MLNVLLHPCAVPQTDGGMCHSLPVYIEFSVASVKSAAAVGCGFLL